MRCPDRSPDEAGRLRALAEYGIDEKRGLPSLDPLVDMAVKLFDCAAAAVNMIGDDHVFLASSRGVGECDMSRDVSFCAHAINQDEVMMVEDAALDARFYDNPLVTAGLIRFYAGVPLKAPSGHALGALCVLDNKPRASFSQQDCARLRELARMVSDKLELRRLEAVATTHPSRFDASAATSPQGVLCFDEHGLISTVNESVCRMFGRPAQEMLGKPVDILIAEPDRAAARAGVERVRRGDAPITVGTSMAGLRRDGQQFPAELYWSRWFDGEQMHVGAIVQDMTEKRPERDALYHLANYDALTGLPNRNLLRRRMEEFLAAGQPVSLILTDLGGFADINNTLGQAAGDQVLIQMSGLIRTALPESAILARVSGDDFATLLNDDDPAAVEMIARAINAAIAMPIIIDGHEVRLSGNGGIAIAPGHGASAEELMSSAELALFHARSSGRGGAFLFIPHLRAEAMARRMYDAELHRALEREEFVLFYQPQIRLCDGLVTGAEALIRWKHPVRGLLAPAAFLPALEAGMLAEPVSRWVLKAACAQAAIWRQLQPHFCMSVNLAAAQFRSGELPSLVLETLKEYGLSPAALNLEITENIILDQQERVLAQLEQLRAFGVNLAFDDFGTGFASLNLLRNFPVTHIKIDKSFTQEMRASPKDQVIVTGLIGVAHQLGLKVIAEGIEKQADADFLCASGCDKGQGFLFGEPLPASIFTERFLANASHDLRNGGAGFEWQHSENAA